MYWITIDQVLCFRTVVQEGSFNRAGERLQRAKSAVRYAVNSLEEQLGFLLLDRKSYRPVTTPKGRAFLHRAETLLTEYDSLQSYCQQIAEGIETRLVISASGLCDLRFLYSVIKQAMVKFPSTEIVLERELLSGERMLFREMVDLAIFENIRNRADLDHKSIGTIRMIPVIAAGHPFLGLPQSKRTPSRLFHYPQIVQRSTLPDEDLQFGIHKESLKWHVADTPSKHEIIVNGLGWGKLPQHMVSNDLKCGRLVELKTVDQSSDVEVFLCRRKSGFMGQVAQYIWNSF